MVIDRPTIGGILQVDFTNCTIGEAAFTLTSNETYEADPSVAINGVKWDLKS